MEEIDWLILLVGISIVLIVLFDIIQTVLHLDDEGYIAGLLFEGIWRMGMKVVRVIPSYRRTLVSMAGPAMIITTIAVWVGLFIVGFAMIYWPYLDLFRSAHGYTTLTFIDALYFSGVTASVLGYGDITPLSDVFQIVSFIQASLGFAFLTGILTFLISVVSGVSDRNALALRLWAETGRSGDGTNAILRSLQNEEISDLRLRLQTLLGRMHSINQKMHQFPILDLFYRSRDPLYSPEIMIRSITQMAITTKILSSDEKYKRLKIVAEELGEVSYELMATITKQHLSKSLYDQLKNPAPNERDLQIHQEICTKLMDNIPALSLEKESRDDKVFELIYQMRIFFIELDSYTGWKMDE